MSEHRLKTVKKYFKDVRSGIKSFEVRINDRDYKVGDTLILEETTGSKITDYYTGQLERRKIIYILDEPIFCKDGYVILGLGESLEDPKPLVLEELQEICKYEPDKRHKPIWIKTLADNKISCQITRGLIKADYRYKPVRHWIDAHWVNLQFVNYGKTWIAYDREPRKEDA